MATTTPAAATPAPPTIDPLRQMGPDILDLFAIIRAEVALTIAALNQRTDGRGQ
jgi:hypothetical protein